MLVTTVLAILSPPLQHNLLWFGVLGGVRCGTGLCSRHMYARHSLHYAWM